ncbi:MAG: T9SS type A sorting domain-containing protein, partial [Candidatus Marinimicrobia bacterium]|nr:T9SS type A sorting domain-containing protein [Candidatus Neomarinimicrobiota bacterium]
GEYYAATDSVVFNWTGFHDEHSGIDHYELAVGTSPGSSNIWPWGGALTDTVYGLAGISLSDGITYYASVRAVDRGGNQSAVASTDGLTIDISGPKGGLVYDGLDSEVDWSNDLITLSGHWQQFFDDGIGLDYYEYSIGTEAGITDIKDWTSNTQDTSLTSDNAGLLAHGDMYYLNIRAFDQIGNMSTIYSSDGVTMDIVAPIVSWLNIGGNDESSDYCGSTDSLRVSVSVLYDELSGFKDCQFALGSAAGYSDIAAWATGEYIINDSIGLIDFIDLTMIEGSSYYGSFRAYDIAGNMSSLIPVEGIIPDVTAPENGIVNDGSSADIAYSNSDSTVIGNWIDFSDELSGISYYQFGLGTQQILADVVSYTNTPFTTVEILNLSLTHGEEYFLSVKAVDNVGNISDPISSNGFIIDKYAGPPTVISVFPDPFTLIPDMEDITITLYLSEPLDEYWWVAGTNNMQHCCVLSSTYFVSPPRVELTMENEVAFADTVTFSFYDYIDYAGLTGDSVTYKYYLPWLADFNLDWTIDVLDLAEFASDWSSAELVDPVTQQTNELGPLTGNVPYFRLIPDSLFNIRDVMAFTRMWNWSHKTQAPAMLASVGSFGEQPIIEQQGSQLILSLPGQAEAGQIVIQYQGMTTDINCSTEDGTTDRILLKDKDVESNQLLVEYAYISKSSAKSITLNTKALTRDNSFLTVYYTLYSGTKELVGQGSQDIELIAVPDQFALHQNYPNPFNPLTTIEYDLPEDGNVNLIIYDILGRQVIQLTDKFQEAGYKSIRWNGRNKSGQLVSAGMYFYAIETNDHSAIRKMILLK